MMHFYGNGYGMMPLGFGIFGWIFMLLWWGLLVTAIVLFIRWMLRQGQGLDYNKKSPIEMLKERYAKGEVTKEEYEEIKKELDK